MDYTLFQQSADVLIMDTNKVGNIFKNKCMYVNVYTIHFLVLCSNQTAWAAYGHSYDDVVAICLSNIDILDPSDKYFYPIIEE